MKKALLASSAIIAAGVIAAPALAAEKKAAGPIALKLGGYFTALGVHTSQDTSAGANRRNFMITREAEVSFSGSTKLDNGVSVGVDVQLEAETCGDQVDESYIWFKGSFGQVVIGAENGAGNKSFRGSSVPMAGFVSTWTSNYRLYGTVGNAAAQPFRADISGDSEKITYWSPKMGGFQVGASYTWDTGEIASSYGGQENDNTAGTQSDIWELGATYSGNTGKDGVSYNISGAYIKGQNEAKTAATDDQKVWALGADVTVAGWTIAGGYGKNNQGTSAASTDLTDWNLGVKSSMGPWSYGISYSHFEAEAGSGAGNDERDHWLAAASYAFGPGISLSAGIENVKIEDNLNAVANENDATSIMLGTALFF
jgi:predicted porin